MAQTIRREIMRVTHYQKPVIQFVMLSTLITLLLALCVGYFYYDTIYQETVDFGNIASDKILTLKTIILAILFVIPLAFYFITIRAYKVSNRLLGCFERILKELDDVAEGKQKKHIHVRPDDELAGDLLKKINAIIDRLP